MLPHEIAILQSGNHGTLPAFHQPLQGAASDAFIRVRRGPRTHVHEAGLAGMQSVPAIEGPVVDRCAPVERRRSVFKPAGPVLEMLSSTGPGTM